MFLDNLQFLNCSFNNLRVLNIETNLKMKTLDFSVNKIVSLSSNFTDKLEFINCRCNQLTILPKLPVILKELNCNYNHLTTLPKLPDNLEFFDCSYNKLTFLDDNIANLRFLNHLNINNNNIENISLRLSRFIQRLMNKQSLEFKIYNDSQNIHEANVNISIKNSIKEIMKEETIISLEL
jgi:Leucine-rich repeat (LRR) protein